MKQVRFDMGSKTLTPGMKVAGAALAAVAVGGALFLAFWLALFVAVSALLLMAGRALLACGSVLVPDRFVERRFPEHAMARRREETGYDAHDDEIVIETETITVTRERGERS